MIPEGLPEPIRWIARQRWARFGLVGVCATLSYYLLGLLFVPLLGMPLLIGNALAYAISFAVSYLGQSRFTFGARRIEGGAVLRFGAAQLFGLGLNSCVVEALSRLGVPYEISMLAACAAAPPAVYLICKFWVFRPEKEA